MHKLVLAALLLPTPALAGASVSHSVGLTDTTCGEVWPGWEICLTYDGVMTDVSTPSGISHKIFNGEILQQEYVGGELAGTLTYDRKYVFHADEDGVFVSKIDQCIDFDGLFAIEISGMYTNGKQLWLDFEFADSCD